MRRNLTLTQLIPTGASLPIALVLLAGVLSFGCAVDPRAASGSPPRIVDHAFSFDTGSDDQEADVLDYSYGGSYLPVRPSRTAVAEGRAFVSANVHGPMARGDSLYVKWRDRRSGKIYEDTVHLAGRLPADLEGERIHFVVKGAQLYVYLISRGRRQGEGVGGGATDRKRVRIYPD